MSSMPFLVILMIRYKLDFYNEKIWVFENTSKGVIDILEASEKVFRIIMPSPALMDILRSQRFIDYTYKQWFFLHYNVNIKIYSQY